MKDDTPTPGVQNSEEPGHSSRLDLRDEQKVKRTKIL